MNDPKRRLSTAGISVSSIFNPLKIRRNSTAVTSHLLGSRNPSVVITDDNLDFEFGCSSMIGIGSGGGPATGGFVNGPHGSASAGGSGSQQQSSVPLLAEIQQHSGHSLGLIENFNQSQQPQRGDQQQQQQQQQGNNTNLKPVVRTLATIKRAIFSKTARKLCCGLFLSLLVGICWTLVIHAIKRAYKTSHLFPEDPKEITNSPTANIQATQNPTTYFNNFDPSKYYPYNDENNPYNPTSYVTNLHNANSHTNQSASLKDVATSSLPTVMVQVYDAPFFTAWILTICTIMFYPIHQITVRFCSCMGRKGPKTMSRQISDAINGFRERGMSLFQFLGRCSALCCLWLLTNWLILCSLRVLRATEVIALFATTTSFVYLLSWVVLHNQFVGVRILAVIMSNMGIALFAYMDGQTYKSPTVGYVLLGATAAGFNAVFKVSLKKSFGFGATISQQVALIFSVVGILSMVMMWPIFITLYFTGVEVIRWSYVPWELIIIAVVSFLLVAMLDNFGVTCTFEFFITIGLLFSIPFSAVLDHHLYMEEFDGMCLAAIITIAIGFGIVLLPENWPDYCRWQRYLLR